MPPSATDPDWEFDHIDPSLAPRMNEVFAALRARAPVVRTEKHGGYWAVLAHADARQAFGDPETFTSTSGVIFPSVVLPGTPQYPIEADPPEHTAYRKIIQKHFTRQAVARYEPLFRELTVQRLGELAGLGAFDAVASLARHLPPVAIALILGLPARDGEKFVAWTGQMFEALVAGDFAALADLNEQFTEYLGAHIERQRAAGADTLITAIADAEVAGRRMTHDEQVQMVLLLVLAGHETTVTSIATMLYLLASVDGLRRRILEDSTLIPAMIDECLRIEGPTIVMSRVARHDTRLAGNPICAGDRIALVLSCANRDPEAFDEPDRFRCPRADNPHLAFGHGVHRCVGEHLAKLQMRIVAEEMLRLMPHYRIADGYEPTWHPGRMMRGLASLPILAGDASQPQRREV